MFTLDNGNVFRTESAQRITKSTLASVNVLPFSRVYPKYMSRDEIISQTNTTDDNPPHVFTVLLHKSVKPEKDVMPMLGCRRVNHALYDLSKLPTLDVVFPHDLKAFEAALMASSVSASPISGTVPSSLLFAGSTEAALVEYHNCTAS
jgi:hypothetical protein